MGWTDAGRGWKRNLKETGREVRQIERGSGRGGRRRGRAKGGGGGGGEKGHRKRVIQRDEKTQSLWKGLKRERGG